MGKSRPPIIYWDTCVFLALLKGDGRDPSVNSGIQALGNRVDKNEIVLVTSVVTRAEIQMASLTDKQASIFTGLLQRSSVRVVEVTEKIAVLAGELRWHYKSKGDGIDNLTANDAYHLATAITIGVTEFHTLDGSGTPGKKRTLLPLDGDVAGHKLRIRLPRAEQVELPLVGHSLTR